MDDPDWLAEYRERCARETAIVNQLPVGADVVTYTRRVFGWEWERQPDGRVTPYIPLIRPMRSGGEP